MAGLVWRDGATVRRNEPSIPEQDLDKLAWPVHRRPFDLYLGMPIVNLLGSRGCRYGCAFCSIAAWHRMCGGDRYRRRSAENLAAEMGCLWREGVRIFNFHDDNFLGTDRNENIAGALALRAALQQQGVGKIAFQIKARPDAVDPELFALLRSMGLFRVFLGIEAGTDASLRNLGRGQTVEDNERALALLHGLDLHLAFNLLVLNPESTLEDLEANVAFMRKHAGTPLNFCRTEVYAGTPLEKRLAAQRRLHGDYWGQDYVIADTRAQQAFEMAMLAFWDRNFGAHPLHYLSSQVDYEHQLRADFFGTDASLRALAKGFIRKVNENTSAHLQSVIDAIRGNQASASFARALARKVAEDDVRLARDCKAVLDRIRNLSASPRRAARTNAAIAASLAVALTGCPSPTPQVMEAAPRPTYERPYDPDADTIGPQVMEAAPYPTHPPEVPTEGPVIATAPDASAPDAASQDASAKDAGGKPDARPDAAKTKKGDPVPVEAKPPDYTHMREAAPPPDERYQKMKRR